MILAELLALKRSDDAGLAAQLTQQLRALMASGRIRSGAMLPSSRSLAAELDVARNTVTHAYEQLVAEGYLRVAARRRPVVTDDIEARFAKALPAPRRDAARKPLLSPWGVAALRYGLAAVLPGRFPAAASRACGCTGVSARDLGALPASQRIAPPLQ
ncbi:GntR family transcriptional regulator [Bradyrhizobium sp. USDA 4509]